MPDNNPSNRVEGDENSILTVNAKQRVRTQLETDIENFLASGGSIELVDSNVTADPPTKPVSRYGGKQI
ncbi:MAG: hypothetical protein KUG79_13115 [Pseudomonadales bacterium]|nr:hypothetical protein [Pseudomonadales bacterium]